MALSFVSSLASLLLASSAIDLIPGHLVQQGCESVNLELQHPGVQTTGISFLGFPRSTLSLSVLERNSPKPACEIFQFHEISSNQNVLAGYAHC